MSGAQDYIRLCPVCGSESAPDASQCAECGTLLLGVDLTLRQPEVTAATATTLPEGEAAAPVELRCPHTDCGQANPPGSASCLYCGRPLATANPPVLPVPPSPTFYRLPAALAEKFRIVEVLPAGGAEAEIMLLEGITSQVKVIAKIYRMGITPKTAVLERVNRAGFAHVVRLIAHGVSEGVGYEVMEYCPAGSLRHMMTGETLPRDTLRQIVEEIGSALAALHSINIIHRDLKPENVLVRRREPLDLVLTDFGIASVNDATQRFTSLARSVRYGAPETLTGVLDHTADYWSLGLIVVELLTGRHPFDGLSDAVITHQLVTNPIDLAAVTDPVWRTLCRGLLLRDPKQRWGADEIRRWLAGDATLESPQEDAPASQALHAARPYQIDDTVCQSATELAAALALHWESGRKDLLRGQLSAWVGQELRDDNLLRFVHDLLERRDISDDMRLMRLIRHLAPDMPPVWCGTSLALPNLLAQAAKAGQGDTAAAEWLVSVFTERVLRELSAAQFPAEAALVARWEAARERCETLWRETENVLVQWRKTLSSRQGVVDFDALVFGQPAALNLPPPHRLLPVLLLLLADEAQAEALRARVRSAATPWLADNPWLDALLAGDHLLGWLVADFLTPHAQRITQDRQQRLQHEANAEAAQFEAFITRANQALVRLRENCDLGWFASELERGVCAQAAASLLELAEEARRQGVPDDTALMRALNRAEPVVLRIQERLDAWEHAARINAAWRNPNLGRGIAGLIFFGFVFAAEFIPGRLLLWGVPGLIGLVVGWRVWGIMQIRSSLRDLGKALPNRVPTILPPMT